MRIACIGNMNNSLFCLTRYLRDKGYDAHLLTLENEPEHFSPEADSYNTKYKSFTKTLNWSKRPSALYHTSKRQILKDISGFDFFIACDVAIAYLAKAGIKTDIFIPYGSDVHMIPYLKFWSYHWRKWHKVISLRYFQRKAIKNARWVSMEMSNPDFETQFITPLRISDKRIFITCPFLYYPQYENGEMEEYAQRSTLYEKFRKIREQHDLVIFHHSRQEWRSDGGLQVRKHVWTKGNNILIKGFSKYVHNNKSVKAALIMFEYGTKVVDSKKLVEELDIKKNTFWFPKSFRKDIMLGIKMADLGVGELGLSWLSYGTILEYMALGIPIAHKRDDTLYNSEEKNLYPMLHASSPEEIYSAIERVRTQSRECKSIGSTAKRWFEKNLVDIPLSHYEDLINNVI